MRSRTALLALLPTLLWIESVPAFTPGARIGHKGVTEEGLAAARAPDGRQFSDVAIKAISNHVDNVDSLVCHGRESWTPIAHCDGDLLAECHDRIANMFEKAAAMLCTCLARPFRRQASAWSDLGSALHTLQDFYSHSNFVNLVYEEDVARVPTSAAEAKVRRDLIDSTANWVSWDGKTKASQALSRRTR